MKINPRERAMLLIGAVIVVGALAWNALNPPATAGQKGKILTAEEAERKKSDSLKEIKRMVQEQEAIQPQIARLAYKRPPDELVPRLIRDLQRLAKQANVRLMEIKPQRSRPLAGSKMEKVSIDIRLRAPFQPNVMHFFYLAEAPEGRMTVEKFNIASADSRLKSVDVSAQITVFTRVTSGANGGEVQNVSAK
jgi:hypothetical protein